MYKNRKLPQVRIDSKLKKHRTFLKEKVLIGGIVVWFCCDTTLAAMIQGDEVSAPISKLTKTLYSAANAFDYKRLLARNSPESITNSVPISSIENTQLNPSSQTSGTNLGTTNPSPNVQSGSNLPNQVGVVVTDKMLEHSFNGANKKVRHLPEMVSEDPVKKLPGYTDKIQRGKKSEARYQPSLHSDHQTLSCKITLIENDEVVESHELGCTQVDQSDRGIVLMQYAGLSSKNLPNMEYAITVQVDRYVDHAPVVRTKVQLKGLIGRSLGQRTYESSTIGHFDKTKRMIAFDIEEVPFSIDLTVTRE